jgi:hypothetical protein
MLRSTGVKMGVHIDDYWKVVAVEGQGERVIEKIPRFRLLRPGEQNAALIYGLVERLHYFDGVFPSELTMRLRTRSGLGRLYRKAQW